MIFTEEKIKELENKSINLGHPVIKKIIFMMIYILGAGFFGFWSINKYRLLNGDDILSTYSIALSIIIFLFSLFKIEKVKKIFWLGSGLNIRPHFFLLLLAIPNALLILGLVIFLNSNLDYSKPIIYDAIVIDKEEFGSEFSYRGVGGKNYYLIFSFSEKETVDLGVSYNEYNKFNIGSLTKITIKSGALGSRWIQKIE